MFVTRWASCFGQLFYEILYFVANFACVLNEMKPHILCVLITKGLCRIPPDVFASLILLCSMLISLQVPLQFLDEYRTVWRPFSKNFFTKSGCYCLQTSYNQRVSLAPFVNWWCPAAMKWRSILRVEVRCKLISLVRWALIQTIILIMSMYYSHRAAVLPWLRMCSNALELNSVSSKVLAAPFSVI